MGVNMRALIGKLNDPARRALENAAGFCLSRTHYEVEMEHYLMKLLDATSASRDGSRVHARHRKCLARSSERFACSQSAWYVALHDTG